MIVDVVIPAFNEESSISRVIHAIPGKWVRNIIVGNNGSTDGTKSAALAAGAIVVDQIHPGYGNACLAALAFIASHGEKPDIVVFLDGDYSDYPEQLPDLVTPIMVQGFDMVIGSRVLGTRERGALLPQQRFGNALATFLIRMFYGYTFTDLGPFRAIRYERLMQLQMEDKNYGWTAEMQVKAAQQKMKCTEVAVNYRKRIGKSKVSGTLTGSLKAGYKILYIIFKQWFR